MLWKTTMIVIQSEVKTMWKTRTKKTRESKTLFFPIWSNTVDSARCAFVLNTRVFYEAFMKCSLNVYCLGLHHASKATTEIAEDLSLEDEFWKANSLIRWRWLLEFERLTLAFLEFNLDKKMTALHIAASVGFKQLVSALIRNGHRGDLKVRDKSFNTPVGPVMCLQGNLKCETNISPATFCSLLWTNQYLRRAVDPGRHRRRRYTRRI
jgi:hypothetical protein